MTMTLTRFGRPALKAVLAFGLALSPTAPGAVSTAAAEARAKAKAAAPADPLPSFNPTDPILKCTAHVTNVQSTYVVVQTPVEQMDDASLAWEKSHPDTPVCVRLSNDDALQFLTAARKNPGWVAAPWEPTADLLKAASAPEAVKPPTPQEQAQDAADRAEAAARMGNYAGALALARKAADLGHPLDASEIDYWTQRSAKQERDAAEAAKIKAAQQAAAATAAQIMERQQKDYRERARKAALAKNDEPSAAQMAMQGQALGGYAQSVGSAVAQNMRNGSLPTTVDAVGSTTFAQNRPLATNGGRAATNCITVDKVTISIDRSTGGPSTVATNKCDFKVVFQWCLQGDGGGQSCPANGGLPASRAEVEAHGRVTIVQQQAGLPVRTWACEAPGAPYATAGSGFECR